jgi:carboxymethylenebutenolidase
MKKLITLLSLSFISFLGFTQDGISICHTPATEKFAALTMNEAFVASHELPKVYVHQSLSGGKMITFKTDGIDGRGYLLQSDKKNQQLDFCFSGVVGFERQH